MMHIVETTDADKDICTRSWTNQLEIGLVQLRNQSDARESINSRTGCHIEGAKKHTIVKIHIPIE